MAEQLKDRKNNSFLHGLFKSKPFSCSVQYIKWHQREGRWKTKTETFPVAVPLQPSSNPCPFPAIPLKGKMHLEQWLQGFNKRKKIEIIESHHLCPCPIIHHTDFHELTGQEGLCDFTRFSNHTLGQGWGVALKQVAQERGEWQLCLLNQPPHQFRSTPLWRWKWGGGCHSWLFLHPD